MRRLVLQPLHPLLFAAAFILQPAVLNGVEPPGYVRPLLVAVLAAAVAVGAARLLTGSWGRAGMAATVGFLLLVSREPLLWLLVVLRDGLGIGTATVVVGVLVTLLLSAAVLAVRSRHTVPPVWLPWTTRAFNIFGIVLVAGALGLGASTTWSWATRADGSTRADVPDADRLPDIFVLLLDGYARDDVLMREFGFDNEPFLAELTDLGFDVDRASHSNYTYSALTFTSLFEVGYVRDEPVASIHDSELRDRLHAALEAGPAVRGLHAAGYEFVGTAAGWEHDSFRGRVDRFLDRPELTDFERQILQRTWILDMPFIPSDLFFQELHKRVTGVLSDAEVIAAENARRHPAFAFVHVAAPHLPIAFAPDGGPAEFRSRLYGAGRASEFGLTDVEYREAYGASLHALNQRIIETVNSIRAGAMTRGVPPPAIIIMSDHGYIGDDPVHGPPMLANLFAASLPGAAWPAGEGPTPVNLVPAILAAYRDDPGIEPIPDRYFTTVIHGQTLDLTEIPRPGRDAE